MQSARRTGRTTSLVESVKDGDRICFACNTEARRVEQLLRERGVQVACIVVDPKSPQDIFGYGTSQGRTIFDHDWVEQYYLAAIEHASVSIDHFQGNASGYGEAHRATRRRAEERWGLDELFY